MSANVLVTVPQGDGWLHKTVSSVTNKLLADKRYSVTLSYPTKRPFENNLHHIMAEIRESHYDYWLNIDSDNPPTRNPLDLVELDKDVIGLPTPVWHYDGDKNERPIYWNGYKRAIGKDGYNEWPEREGLQLVDAIGTGCFLMARRVVDAFNNEAAFERTLLPDGRVDKGNDIAFSERARGKGFFLWMHYDYPCDHICEIPLNDAVRAIKGLCDA